MRREDRYPSSAARRRTEARVGASDSGRLGRRKGPIWFTISQLCRRWQLSRKTIYKFIDANILPAWKVGSHLYRIAVADVLRFEAANKLAAIRPADRGSFPTDADRGS